jgi:hypothetical protein
MRGGPSTPPKEGMTPAYILFPFGHQPFAGPPVIMTCPGLSWAVLCGRAERIPPRKPPFASSPALPRKAVSHRLIPLGGAGSARPEGKHHANPNIAPPWPPASRKGTGGNAMPCHSSGHPVRTRRPRPSEKIALRVISGTFPQGRLTPANPLGGAGSARPQRGHGLDRGMWPVGRRPFAYAFGRDEMPGHPEGRTTRTHGVRPSEKTAFRVIWELPPLGHPSSGGQSRGGPGSARPEGKHHANPNIAPPWPPASRKGTGGNAMPCHSCGRTVRARRPRPSEKIALRIGPGFSP